MIFQEPFLNQLRIEHVPVNVFLSNGVRLSGMVESFDAQIILLRGEDRDGQGLQMVYKHAISSIVPQREIKFPSPRPPGVRRGPPQRNNDYYEDDGPDYA